MKIGLALSGGGFRATMYHLGLVRFLRDAGILPNVTDITAVSGGSIIAAHLCLNWGRYNGSPSEFDAAATELLSFVLGAGNSPSRSTWEPTGVSMPLRFRQFRVSTVFKMRSYSRRTISSPYFRSRRLTIKWPRAIS